MRISFDADGVVFGGQSWFFRLFPILSKLDPAVLRDAELKYYSTAPLQLHPHLFLAEGDEGFIITARKPYAQEITRRRLNHFGITLPVIFVDPKGEVNWDDYARGSSEAARRKAEAIIKRLG